MCFRRGIASRICRVIEVPEPDQPCLSSRVLPAQVRANLLLGARDLPDAEFIDFTGKGIYAGGTVAQVPAADEIARPRDSVEAFWKRIGPNEKSVQKQLHPTWPGDQSQMMPLPRFKEDRDE